MRRFRAGGPRRVLAVKSRLVLLALLLVPGYSRAQTTTTNPIPITVTAQTLCHHFAAVFTCDSGGPSVTHSFNESDGQGLTVNGSITAANTDGKIVYTISGMASNTSGGPRSFFLSGTQALSFSIPQISASTVNLPAALIVGILDTTSSTLNLNMTRTLYVPGTGAVFSSSLLGSSVFVRQKSQDVGLGLHYCPACANQSRVVVPETVPADDGVQATFAPDYSLSVPGGFSGSISETFTYELRYVPEPSAAAMLSSGAGLLALLTRAIGPRAPAI
jgi:hypothetical protein